MKKQFLLMLLLAVLGFSQQGFACQAGFTWANDSSGSVHFTNTSTGLNTAGYYLWTFNDGTSSTQMNPVHQFPGSSHYMVCLTVWDSAGCQSTFCDTIYAIVPGACQAFFTVSGQANNTVMFDNQSTPWFTGMLWDFGDGTTSNSAASHTYSSPGNYTVCLYIGTDPASACSDHYCTTVTVTGNTVNCDAQFTSIDTAGGILFVPDVLNAPVSYTWTFGDGSTSSDPVPFHTYNANGYYNVCLTITDSVNNCSAIWCDSIGVGIPNTCNAYYTYQNTSAGTQFHAYGNGSPGAPFSQWYWTFGDGTAGTGLNPVHVYAHSGVYTVCLYASSFACADTNCQMIQVNVNTPVCDAHFTHYDSSGVKYFMPDVYSSALNYHWSFGDGTSSTQPYPNHIYNTNGYYNVCLTITDSLQNCTASWCDSIYSGNGTTTGCQAGFSYQAGGGGLYVYGYNANPASSFTNWFWDFGDGTTGTGQNPMHVYQSNGLYTVCLYASNLLCADTVCHSIMITGAGNTPCNSGFTVSDSAGFHYFIPDVVAPHYIYHWDFGDNTNGNGAVVAHQYVTPGTYIACLTVTDSFAGCTSTHCDSVIVTHGNPAGCVADFSYQGGNAHTFFSGYSSNPGTTFTNWFWDFGDGTTGAGQTPIHFYTLNGTYTVCLYASNSFCADTICKQVTVISGTGVGCDATFNAYDSAGVKFFVPHLISNAVNYHWDFGDNTTSTQVTPSHQYSGTGPYLVCLVVTDSIQGCTATHCDSVYGSSTPVNCQAYYSYTSDSTFNVNFFNASVGNYTHAQWSFGDGTSSMQISPTHQYNSPGPYLVCLTIYSNTPANTCQSAFCDTIYPGQNANSCVPVFYSYPDSTVFGNGNVNFALMGGCANTTYVWSFGDGTSVTTTSSNPPPAHQFPATGWYNVCVTATTPTNVYNYCNQVYAFRLTSGLGSIDKLNTLVYPNPAGANATIKFNAAGETVIHVYSLDGRLASTQNAGVLNGEVQLPLQVASLDNGVYFVQLHSGDLNGTVRILIQH